MTNSETLIGQTIGSYEVVRLLGEGGMGAVYLGEHPEIKSRVAIKVLHPQFVSNETIVRRFLDEARAVNRIGHPGIVRIHDANTQEGVGVYLVMEFLEGETLGQRVRREGALPPVMVGRLVRQSAAALAASHEAGIVHRDLKPANIFVLPDPDVVGGERVKILDFGIAKLLENADAVDATTKTGMVIGSPMYMSPEQCIDSKNLDARTDVYSLGAIAYTMLTGQLPYKADTLGKLILKHQKELPRRPSLVKEGVPTALEEVVMAALVTDREERIPSMAAMRDRLVEALQRLSGEAPAVAPRAPASAPEPTPPSAEEDIAGAATQLPGAREKTTLSGAAGETREQAEASAASRGRSRRLAMAVIPLLLLLGVAGLWGAGVFDGAPAVDGGGTLTSAGEGGGGSAGAAAGPRQNVASSGQGAATGVAVGSPDAAAPDQGQPDEPKQVRITLKVTPESARVLLDGEEESQNPLVLPKDGGKYALRVEAKGYQPYEEELLAEDDREIAVKLKPAARARKAGASGERRGKAKPRPRPRPKPRPETKPKKEEGPYFEDL